MGQLSRYTSMNRSDSETAQPAGYMEKKWGSNKDMENKLKKDENNAMKEATIRKDTASCIDEKKELKRKEVKSRERIRQVIGALNQLPVAGKAYMTLLVNCISALEELLAEE